MNIKWSCPWVRLECGEIHLRSEKSVKAQIFAYQFVSMSRCICEFRKRICILSFIVFDGHTDGKLEKVLKWWNTDLVYKQWEHHISLCGVSDHKISEKIWPKISANAELRCFSNGLLENPPSVCHWHWFEKSIDIDLFVVCMLSSATRNESLLIFVIFGDSPLKPIMGTQENPKKRFSFDFKALIDKMSHTF